VLDSVPVVEAQLLADAGEGPLGGLALLHLGLLHTTAPHHTNMNITTIGSCLARLRRGKVVRGWASNHALVGSEEVRL
jgi:hypothetical protein